MMKNAWESAVRRQVELLNLVMGVVCGVCLGGSGAAYYFAIHLQRMTEFAHDADIFISLESTAENVIFSTLVVVMLLVIFTVKRALKGVSHSTPVEGTNP